MSLTLSGDFFAVSALAISIVTLIRSFMKDDKSLENRITALEGAKMTPDERKCLNEVNVKVGLLYGILVKELGQSLKQDSTPEFDELLESLSLSKPANDEQTLKLLGNVDREYVAAVASENTGRRLALALLRGMLELDLGILKPEDVCLCKPTPR